jgi:uncharacterized 2Fe-2S/4Fe-4S cluster protein (DUF4445 family)
MKMVELNFIEQGVTAKVEAGTTILEAARKVGVVIEAPCDAIGTCGKCKVSLYNYENANIVIKEGKHHLSEDEIKKGYVLACQAEVYDNLTVRTASTASQNKTLKILSDGESFSYNIRNHISKKFNGENTVVYAGNDKLGEEIGDTASHTYGLSIDIGTTTLVTALIDLHKGEEIYSVSALNPQSLHAQDVLTRIKFASNPDGLEAMYSEITNELNKMIGFIAKEANIDPMHIYEVVYSGNTTMIHLACNVDPASLGKYPYTPKLLGGNNVTAKMLNISPFGLIYLPPIISAYVGPDITSGVLASQLHEKEGITLFIDIGTNGEMVISNNGKLSATSTAAGPAFEGMNITFGMRAGKGALEYFEITHEGEIETGTIGSDTPIGICGSGLLDIVGELVKAGVIGPNGKFVSPEKGTYDKKLKERLVSKEGKLCFKVEGEVYLTQKDIRQVQLAKGAVRAGVEALMQSQDVTVEEVDSVEIAGSFGYHLRAKSLLNIGLLPKGFEGKIRFVGNTSKSGGKAFLLNSDFRSSMSEVVKKIDCVELANRPDFDKLFVNSLSF